MIKSQRDDIVDMETLNVKFYVTLTLRDLMVVVKQVTRCHRRHQKMHLEPSGLGQPDKGKIMGSSLDCIHGGFSTTILRK